jgi:hypothetical protein
MHNTIIDPGTCINVTLLAWFLFCFEGNRSFGYW